MTDTMGKVKSTEDNTGTCTAQSECNGLLGNLVKNMEKEALRLKEKDVFYPEQGKKYYLNLRANILQDFADVIRKTIRT